MTSRAPALAALLLALLPTPVRAGTNAMTLVGTGFTSPGLSLTELLSPLSGPCRDEDVSFSGTAVLTGADSGTYTVSIYVPTQVCGGTETGDGTISGDLAGDVHFARTSVYLTLSGRVSINGGPTTVFALSCPFVATSVSPTTTFALSCAGTVGIST